MSEKRTMMQIFDDWKVLECDPYPPKGRNERSESFANLFALMKKEGYSRSEIERKMLSPLMDICVSPNLKDKKLAKSLKQSTENAFRRGLSIAFIDEYDNEVIIERPEPKTKEPAKTVFIKAEAPEIKTSSNRRTVKYDEVPDSGFDFSFGGLFEQLEKELEEKEGKDE